MLYVCYSGFHWMLISGLMGLPTLLVTSFIHLEFSLESNPGKKPRNGEWETEWWICACWGVKIALRFQGGSHIYFLLVLRPLAVPCAWGFTSGNRKALSLVVLPYCSIHLHWLFSIYPSERGRAIKLCSLWMVLGLGFLLHVTLPDWRW